MISDKQRKGYFRLWNAARKAQGWTTAKGWTTAQAEAKRREVQAAAIGVEKSSKFLSDEELDRVLSAFAALGDSVRGTRESDHPEEGKARRWVWVIKNQLTPCLKLYVGDGVEAYLDSVLRDRFKVFKGLGHWTELDPLPVVRMGKNGKPFEGPGPLQQFLITVSRLLQDKRSKAGDSIHAMKTKAGVRCDCAVCSQRRTWEAAKTKAQKPSRKKAKKEAEVPLENQPF